MCEVNLSEGQLQQVNGMVLQRLEEAVSAARASTLKKDTFTDKHSAGMALALVIVEGAIKGDWESLENLGK